MLAAVSMVASRYLFPPGFHKSQVVALLGVSLSEAQEKLLLEHFPHLVQMLDGDEAGQRASYQLAKRLRAGVSLSIVKLPTGRQRDQLSSEEIERIVSRASDASGA